MKRTLLFLFAVACGGTSFADECKQCKIHCPVLAAVVQKPTTKDAVSAVQSDPWGFLSALNSTRAQHGLAALRYDANLSQWAADNCRIMTSVKVSGHYSLGDRSFWQVALYGAVDAPTAVLVFMGSPSHRNALLQPGVTIAGVWFDGSSWTANLK